MPFAWKCPYCQRDTTIAPYGFSENIHFFNSGNKDGLLGITTKVIVCPNQACKEYAIVAKLQFATKYGDGNRIDPARLHAPLQYWNLRPQSSAQALPDYIPSAIKVDYEEACLIKTLSPKASATLSRRCLQGIIRDFWEFSKSRLVDEIEAIKDKTDPLTWDAIDSVRKIGNIGAHMERDINVIIDVDDKEADLLISLIEILVKDWYVTRHERRQRLDAIVSTAAAKDIERESKKDSKS